MADGGVRRCNGFGYSGNKTAISIVFSCFLVYFTWNLQHLSHPHSNHIAHKPSGQFSV